MIKCEIQERGLGGGRKFGDTGRETDDVSGPVAGGDHQQVNRARSGLWDPHYLEWGERMLKKSKPRGRSRARRKWCPTDQVRAAN